MILKSSFCVVNGKKKKKKKNPPTQAIMEGGTVLTHEAEGWRDVPSGTRTRASLDVTRYLPSLSLSSASPTWTQL